MQAVYKVITPATLLPISLAEAKAQLNIAPAFADDDAFITDCIKAAANFVADHLQGPLMQTEYELQMSGWDKSPLPTEEGAGIQLWKCPVVSLTSLKYFDLLNVDQTVAPGNYTLDNSGTPGRLIFASGYSLPGTFQRFDSVRLRFIAGYAAQADVPFKVKQAVQWVMSQFYLHRSPQVVGVSVSPLELTVEKLLATEMAYL